MRRLFFGLAIGAVAAMTSSWAFAGDQEITQQVIQRLDEQKKTGQLQGFHLGVSVKDGQVWLKGYTANEQQRLAVLDAARRVPGVKAVVNELAVDPTAGRTKTASTSAPSSATQSTIASAPEAASAPTMAPSRAAVQPIATTAPANSAARLTSAAETAPPAAPARTVAPAKVATAVPLPATAPVANGHSGHRGMPLAAYPNRPVNYNGPGVGGPMVGGPGGPGEMMGGQPIPAYNPAMGGGVAPARYDHPRMPGYAWPAYAAYPNYAAVTYPRQYSPTAWPYIGPFYPYPQVPLGWRKVTLEWDDGWWMLDFKDK